MPTHTEGTICPPCNCGRSGVHASAMHTQPFGTARDAWLALRPTHAPSATARVTSVSLDDDRRFDWSRCPGRGRPRHRRQCAAGQSHRHDAVSSALGTAGAGPDAAGRVWHRLCVTQARQAPIVSRSPPDARSLRVSLYVGSVSARAESPLGHSCVARGTRRPFPALTRMCSPVRFSSGAAGCCSGCWLSGRSTRNRYA